MKTNFKFLTIASILFLSTITASKAQDVAKVKTHDWRLGVGLNGGIPTGDAESAYNFALGGDLKLQRDFTESIAGTLTTGYTNLFIKKDLKNLGFEDYGYVPVKAGIKVFPTKGFYFSGEIGAGIGVKEGSSTGFLYSPGVGVAFQKDWDVSLRYEAVKFDAATFGQIALRLAYAFSL